MLTDKAVKAAKSAPGNRSASSPTRAACTSSVPSTEPVVGDMKLWLTNRRRDKWREKIDVEQSGSVTVVPT